MIEVNEWEGTDEALREQIRAGLLAQRNALCKQLERYPGGHRRLSPLLRRLK